MANTYDFYKPKLDSEYPEVDGPVSITAYISAIDASYKAFRTKHTKAKKAQNIPGPAFSLEDVDYPVFHSPYGKMVQKAHARLVYNDFLANPDAPKYANVPDRETWLSQPYKASLTDKNLEKTFMGVAKAEFESTVEKGMKCARRCGNMYTASLYGGLASLLASVEPSELRGKRISMFAFGSGLASSLFTIKVKGDTTEIQQKLDLVKRLESMKVVPCQEYVDSLTVSLSSLYTRCFRDAHRRALAPSQEPQRGVVRARRLARQHLAGWLVPREHRQQVPPQVRSHPVGVVSASLRPSVVAALLPSHLQSSRTHIHLIVHAAYHYLNTIGT